MGRKTAKYESHDFYCMNCGNKTFPIMRKEGHKHSRGHKKALYCPYCRVEVNCIEVTCLEDKEWFLEEFAAGHFKEEAANSIEYIKENAKGWVK